MITATEEVMKSWLSIVGERFIFAFFENFMDKIAKYVEGDARLFTMVLYVSFQVNVGTLTI